MLRILEKYIGRTIISSILITVFILISLSGIIKFVEQLRKVGNGSYTIWNAGIFTLLTIPKDIEIFFPMAALLGTLIKLGTLASRNELIVMQTAGFSRLQIGISVMKIAIPLMILTMIIGEWIAPSAEQWARNYRTEKIIGKSLMMTDRGLWAKDGNNFIHIQYIIDKNKIKDISIYQLDKEKKLKAVIFANSGYYNHDTNQWQLIEVNKALIKNKKEITGFYYSLMNWQTTLNPEKLGIVSLNPDSLTISNLYKYINYLQETQQEASAYQLSMWKKIISPLSVACMIFLALSFIFGPLRDVTMGVRVLIGISGGFIFYLLNDGFGNLSLVYGLSPLIAATLPSIMLLGFSILLLIYRR
ncbi:LPS export ABC transporter permease LptG [Arsenophonus symbiont of Ornithomya chloropus]|uniref:LPS export ABC transporter permease LptG n=1 Tax=Arsenophonus symbiont of Ornithomya chloropus TaxID=634121 RepID=UPI0032B2D120